MLGNVERDRRRGAARRSLFILQLLVGRCIVGRAPCQHSAFYSVGGIKDVRILAVSMYRLVEDYTMLSFAMEEYS
jgi:hypothetical protein